MDDEDIVERIELSGGARFTLTRAEREAFTGKAWKALCRWIRLTQSNSLYGTLRSEGFAFDDMIHEFASPRARWDLGHFHAIIERLVHHKALLGREDEEVRRLTSFAEFGVHLLKTQALRHNPDASLYRPTPRRRPGPYT